MGRYNLNNYDNEDGPPWWAKWLGFLAVACIGAVWHRLKTGQW